MVSVEAVQSFAGLALAAWLLFDHLAHAGTSGAVLLMVYWALNLPALGQEIALIAQQYPGARNVTLRLLEPLGAPEEGMRERETVLPAVASLTQENHAGVAITFEQVSVRAAGHRILDEIDVAIPAGSHVAIVGPSGAGKSSLVGLLLGWHRAAEGRVRSAEKGEGTHGGVLVSSLARVFPRTAPPPHFLNISSLGIPRSVRCRSSSAR